MTASGAACINFPYEKKIPSKFDPLHNLHCSLPCSSCDYSSALRVPTVKDCGFLNSNFFRISEQISLGDCFENSFRQANIHVVWLFCEENGKIINKKGKREGEKDNRNINMYFGGWK